MSLTNFLLYYLSFILYTARSSSSVGGMSCWQALGPGFDPQVPHVISMFFLLISPYAAHYLMTIMCPHNLPCHAPHDPNPKVQIWRTSWAPVNAYTRAQKSQIKPWNIGPDCYQHTSKWAYKPPIVCFLSPFLFFYFTCLI